MIISYNFYYARPGHAGAVLQQRILASNLRARLGLPRGRIISKIEGGDDWPDVIWRLDFAGMAEQDADMKARAASPEFEAVRQGMRRLYRRFERPLYAPLGRHARLQDGQTSPSLLLYGVYCDAAAGAAVRSGLDGLAAVEFRSGATDVPRFLCETGTAGLPQELLQNLGGPAVRIERSVWRVADQGEELPPADQ